MLTWKFISEALKFCCLLTMIILYVFEGRRRVQLETENRELKRANKKLDEDMNLLKIHHDVMEKKLDANKV